MYCLQYKGYAKSKLVEAVIYDANSATVRQVCELT